MNVVSVFPSGTELLASLGVVPDAVSHQCDYPPAVVDRPRVTARHESVRTIDADPDAPSGAIHESVQAAVVEDGVHEVDVEALRAADPDLILTQGLCGRCAVDTGLVHEAVTELDTDPEILSLTATNLEDVLDNIERVGRAVGRPGVAATKRAYLERRIDAVAATADRIDSRPRVLVFEWLDPPTLSGHWVPAFIDHLDATRGLVAPGEDSSPIDWDRVLEFDPELVIAAPCGFTVEQTVDRFDELASRPGWDSLTAVETDAVYAMAGTPYMNRTTPRLVDSLEIVASIVYPAVFGRPPERIVQRMDADGTAASPTST